MIAVEIERAGIVTAVVTTMTPVAIMVGPNRIVPGTGIAHPLGNPTLKPEKEKELRRTVVQKALESLQTDLTEQRLFPLDN